MFDWCSQGYAAASTITVVAHAQAGGGGVKKKLPAFLSELSEAESVVCVQTGHTRVQDRLDRVHAFVFK
jgi:hypothetical protein